MSNPDQENDDEREGGFVFGMLEDETDDETDTNESGKTNS